MSDRLRFWSRDMRAGARILANSRFFLRQFNDYWLGEGLSARMDDWTHKVRENLNMRPDPKLEERRARRRAT